MKRLVLECGHYQLLSDDEVDFGAPVFVGDSSPRPCGYCLSITRRPVVDVQDILEIHTRRYWEDKNRRDEAIRKHMIRPPSHSAPPDNLMGDI